MLLATPFKMYTNKYERAVLNIAHKECDQKYSLNKTINYLIAVAILKLFYIEWWREKPTAKPARKINIKYILDVQYILNVFDEAFALMQPIQHKSSKVKVNFLNFQIIRHFRW